MEARCAAAEHCTCEIRQSLLRLGLTAADADAVVDKLVDTGFVDDSRFARAFVRDRYRFSAWGIHKLRAALIAKRIPSPIIADALEAIDRREYIRTAFRAIAARLRQLPPDMEPRLKRQRLMRHAASRGYEMTLIVKILDSPRLWGS